MRNFLLGFGTLCCFRDMHACVSVMQFSFAFLFISFGLSLQEGFGLLARRRFVNLTWVAFVGGIELFAVGAAALGDALAGEHVSWGSIKGK